MKVAIVHDYIKEYGGAEKVLEELHAVFPDAPIYTSLYAPKFLGPHRERFKEMTIKPTGLQNIPFKHKFISPFRLLSPFAFNGLDLKKYDVILVSQTGAYFPNLVRKGNAKLITYTHTPPRYLYGYATARDWKSNKFKLVVGSAANHILRMVDFKASGNVDQFIANSEEVASRIQKFYRRDATVIYPPVDIPEISVSNEKSDFYLTGGRLARAKGIDTIIKAFNENKKSLKIFGKGFAGYEDELRVKAGKNIEFLGEVKNEEKWRLMGEAKAFIMASRDEDFGITPVEAMACGTPVIAFKSGGVKETVEEGKTGIFFEKNTAEDLNTAIKKFQKTKFDSSEIRKHAQKFSTERFRKEVKEFVEKYA